MQFDAPFVTLPANKRGRDFCIGDLHGCHAMLQRLLKAVGFNVRRDRLFSVGDLVHRGPSSTQCLRLVKEDWFYPVMGNHEAMQMGAYRGEFFDGRSVFSMCEFDGPEDPLRPGMPDQAEMEALLGRLPLAIEFPLRDGRRIGVVHAGLPNPWTWTDVRAMTEQDDRLYDRYGNAQKRLLWDRQPLTAAAVAALPDIEAKLHTLYPAATRYDYMQATQPVAELDLLVSGHTTLLGKPLLMNNRLYIDTGAGMWDGRLTMVELGTEHYWEVPDPRATLDMPVSDHYGFQHSKADLVWLTNQELKTMDSIGRRGLVDPKVRLFFPKLGNDL